MRDLEPLVPDEGETATLLLSTRADATHDQYDGNTDPHAEANEEVIDRVDLFFFTDSKSTDAAFYTHELTGVGSHTTADLSVKVPVEMFEPFGAGSETGTIYIYALVNLPADIVVTVGKDGKVDGRSATLENLKQQWVKAEGKQSFVSASVPETFVMRGDADVKVEKESDKLMHVSGVVVLERLASKIRLWAEIPDEIFIDPQTGVSIREEDFNSSEAWEAAKRSAERWTPVLKEVDDDAPDAAAVKLYLYNLTTFGRMDGALGSDRGYENIDRREAYEDVVRELSKSATLPEADRYEDYPFSHTRAYYSYPNAWDNTQSSGQHPTYVIIRVPWKKETEESSEYENYYYQVPVNALAVDNGPANCLVPNRYYRIKIRIGMLGSKDLGSPLPVDASYEVVPWQTADVDVHIKDRRYLVVNQKEWVMNNTSTIEIPFSTSHEVEVEACYVNYFRYNDIWGKDPHSIGTHNATEFDEWVNAAGDIDEGLIEAEFRTGINKDGTTVIPPKDGDDYKIERKPAGFFQITRDVRVFTTEYITSQMQTRDELYYKKDYFEDPYLHTKTYYVGHEHPKTFQEDYIKYREDLPWQNSEDDPALTVASQQNAWKEYIDKYQIESVYTCTVDPAKNVIRFNHPLVLWNEIRANSEKPISSESNDVDGPIIRIPSLIYPFYYYRQSRTRNTTKIYSRELKYYTPVINPKTGKLWDEFSRCEIIIKIKHKDWTKPDDLYRETIHITQYPGMYITVSHNYGTVDTGEEDGGSNKQQGNYYTKVNGHGYYKDDNASSGRQYHPNSWDVVTYLSDYAETSSNVNPNMYLIHTTQLSEDIPNQFEIGDPRTIFYNNNLATAPGSNGSGNNNAPDTGFDAPLKDVASNETGPVTNWTGWNMPDKSYYSGNEYNLYGGGLHYYYPTDESTGNGSKENFIAPVFRIASSYGIVVINSRTSMRRRCAAYQEAGRPAGRWRLPTKAEIQYIATLSAQGKIPILFGSTINKEDAGYYWSANGGLAVTGSGSVSDSRGTPGYGMEGVMAARCVYDEWYWTQVDGGDFPETTRETGPMTWNFFWGDRKKDNTQTQTLIDKTRKMQTIEK